MIDRVARPSAIIVFLTMAALFIALIWFFFAGGGQVAARAISPDGRREARVQLDALGACCGAVEGVFIKSAWIPLDGPNLSCAALAFEVTGDQRIEISWLNDRTLQVRHNLALGQKAEVRSASGRCK
jgi:hypothetical protein